MNNKNKNMIIGILIAIICIIVAFVGYSFLGKEKDESEYGKQVKIAEDMNKDDQQDKINKIVKENEININYTSYASFDKKGNSTSFNVKNIKENHHPLIFKILDEDDKLIYESDKIEQGYEINEIKLDKKLPAGKHNCKIVLGYEGEGNVSSSFPITIEVK